jgi:hypothetical protein
MHGLALEVVSGLEISGGSDCVGLPPSSAEQGEVGGCGSSVRHDSRRRCLVGLGFAKPHVMLQVSLTKAAGGGLDLDSQQYINARNTLRKTLFSP